MTQAPIKRRLPRDQRRDLVLDAALRVFAADGYTAASMGDIAAGAGISKPVLYEHFESKRQLYIAVLGEQVSALRSRVLPHANPAEGTIEARIRLSAYAALSFARERPDAWRCSSKSPSGIGRSLRLFAACEISRQGPLPRQSSRTDSKPSGTSTQVQPPTQLQRC